MGVRREGESFENGRREKGVPGSAGVLRLGISSALADYLPLCITR